MIDYVASAIEKRLPLGAELQVALNLIPAHTWYAVPSGALTFLNDRASDYIGLPNKPGELTARWIRESALCSGRGFRESGGVFEAAHRCRYECARVDGQRPIGGAPVDRHVCA